MNDNDLKFCPCCGKEARIHIQGHREYAPTFYVKCTSFVCGIQTPDTDSKNDAVRIWNRRKDV